MDWEKVMCHCVTTSVLNPKMYWCQRTDWIQKFRAHWIHITPLKTLALRHILKSAFCNCLLQILPLMAVVLHWKAKVHLIPSNRFFLEKLMIFQKFKKPSHFSERNSSSSWSQKLATFLYSESDASSWIQPIFPHLSSLRCILILWSHEFLGFPSCLFPLDFRIKTTWTFLPRMCHMLNYLILLGLITRVTCWWALKILKLSL